MWNINFKILILFYLSEKERIAMTRINGNQSFNVQENKIGSGVLFKGVHFKRGKKLERTPDGDSFSTNTKKPEKNHKEKIKKFFKAIGNVFVAAALVFGTIIVVKKTDEEAKVDTADKATDGSIETVDTIVASKDGKIAELEGQMKIAEEELKAEKAQLNKIVKIMGFGKINSLTPLTTEELAKIRQKRIQDTVDAIELLQNGEPTKPKGVSNYELQYSEIADSATLGYDYKEAPLTFYKQQIYSYHTTYDINEIEPFNPEYVKSETLCVDDLKKEFNENGQIEYEISPAGEHKKVYDENAFIGNSTPENLGKTISSGISIDYGKRINWSKQKIARDIMQNFYDGHGHTLDGVKIEAEKLENGKTKIRVSGDGVYSYKHLLELGSGSKEEDPYNAGGFGEGTRILADCMLAKKSIENITYASADWKMTFFAENNSMKEKLEKSDNSIDGNYVEFETSDNEFVNFLFDSVNYFEHSKNPDFKNLTYDSKDFGFSFLPNKEKGNIYFTQRFEFDGAGNWDNNVDNMTLIFRKKPDPEKYKEITGVEFPSNRDRTSLTLDDIENLTHYYAHEMSDNDIMRTIITSKPFWGSIKENSPIDRFLAGMLKEAKSRKLALDTKDEKIVCKGDYNQELVINTLNSYGYKILPKSFDNICLLSANNAFRNLSAHKTLEPTPLEIKKLKLLEEGVQIIQDNINKALIKHLGNMPEINLDEIDDFSNEDFCYAAKNLREMKINEDSPCFKKLGDKYSIGSYLYKSDYEKFEPEEKKELITELWNNGIKSIKEKTVKGELDNNDIQNFAKALLNLSQVLKDSTAIKDYAHTLYDLNLITKEDIRKPRYIFDRHNEIASNTLGEAIINNEKYDGHWVDREYLDTADFHQILGTWIHEICHKSGGDGTSKFTYALTDMLRVLLRSGSTPENSAKLEALEKVYNSLDFQEPKAA